jgi:hypothetical protein
MLPDQWGRIGSFLPQEDARRLETVSQTLGSEAPRQDCNAHTCATCATLSDAGWFGDIKDGLPSTRRTVWSKTCERCEKQCGIIQGDYLSIISAAIETGTVFLLQDLPPYRRGTANLCINDQKFRVPQYVKFLKLGVVPDLTTEALGWHGDDGWEEVTLKSIWERVNNRRPLVSMCWSLSVLLNTVVSDFLNPKYSYLTVTKTEWEPALVWLRAILTQFAAYTAPRFQEKVWFYAVYRGNRPTWNNNYIEMCMHISKSTNVDDLHEEWKEFERKITYKYIPSQWHPQDSWVAAMEEL